METRTTSEITIAYPEVAERHLWIAVGACQLAIAAGAGEAWVAGSYDDPSGAVPCKIVEDGGLVRIAQEYHWPGMIGSWAAER